MILIRRKRTVIAAALLAALCLGGCAKKSSGGALTRKGMTLLEEGSYQDALSRFEEAVSKGEDTVMAQRGLGLAYVSLARYEEATKAFRTALSAADEKMPKTKRDIRLYLILSLLREDNYAEAVNECNALSESGENSVELHYYFGCAYLGQGEEAMARESFDKAIALASDDYTLYLQIYQAFEDRSLSAVGNEYLQKALLIVPEGNEEAFRLGQIYYYLGQYDKARSTIDSAVSAEYLPALELLGEIFLAQEDYPHALATYEQIRTKQGDSPIVYNGLALCSIASGDLDTALGYIETGLTMEEDEGKQQLRFNEIVVYEKKLDFETALVKAEAYVTLYPTDEAGRKEYTFLQTQGR